MILHTSLSKKIVCVANRYQWEMHHSKEWCTSDEITRYSAKEPPMKWECSSECKILSDSDVCTIIDLDIVFAGGAWILKNEQRNRDATAKKRGNTSGVGKSNNYYEDIYIPPYSNTH